MLPLCLRRLCPARLGSPGGQKTRQDMCIHPRAALFLPAPPPRSFGSEVPDPKANLLVFSSKPQLTEMTRSHTPSAPVSPRPSPRRRKRGGEERPRKTSQPRTGQPSAAPGRPLSSRGPGPGDTSRGSEERARPPPHLGRR